MEINKNALRRLRLLQFLAYAQGEWLAAVLLLNLLQDDADLTPDHSKVLRSLIWLEDQGLADTLVRDLGDNAVTFSRITDRGREYLDGDYVIDGIYHPDEMLELL